MRLFFITLLLASTFLSCSEEYKNSYSNYEEAEKLGAVKRGWVPDFLNEEYITDIKEKHNIDTNEVWIYFSIDVGDYNFSSNLSRFEEEQLGKIEEVFRENFKIRSNSLQFYLYSPTEFLAIDFVNNTGYYYKKGY